MNGKLMKAKLCILNLRDGGKTKKNIARGVRLILQ